MRDGMARLSMSQAEIDENLYPEHIAGPPEYGHGSVDPTEVSHFSNLASSWWDPHGPSRLLHLMNQMRHPFIQRCLASQSSPPPPRLRYLDVGCGGGIFAESAARQPNTVSVLGIDPTPEVLAVAEAHKRQDPLLMEQGRLTYKNIAIEQLPRDETFDIVSCFEVVEHVNTPADFLQHLMAHVKPGGWLVGSTIARTWTSWATTIVAAEDILRMVPKGTHDWNKYINDDELRGWFAGQPGWENPRIMGVMYVPGLGWKEVPASEKLGNYFFAFRRSEA
ncbi:hexaprenyldihydroxybenzoate methyltransferase [Macrophomina phaseolina]|nr:hexaprenyldihydroxybenzoate methyltransferase [Macrophomina phaseolina]